MRSGYVKRLVFDMIKVSDAKVVDLKKYEVLIFGGGIYASGIPVTSFLKKRISKLWLIRKIIVFCDGASPYEEKCI